MKPARPEILVLTNDFALAHAATLAAPEAWIECHDTPSAALFAITPDTRVLVCDSAMANPFGRLLPALFVDQHPGRRAIVVQRSGEPEAPFHDERVVTVTGDVDVEALSRLLTWDDDVARVAAA